MKLNGVTKIDPFLLSFTNAILEIVVGYELYSTLDRFNGYNQILMVVKY